MRRTSDCKEIRHRQQVARAIVGCGGVRLNKTGVPEVDGAIETSLVRGLLDGGVFDVTVAREYGEKLIAEARRTGVHAVVEIGRAHV